MKSIFFSVLFLASFYAGAQHTALPDTVNTTTNANESKLPVKLEHAEPLYIDLIRDLGAHKGEKEWNVGTGMTDRLGYDEYEFLVEYEWAPINRLGLEIEVPVTLYSRNNKDRFPEVNRPSDRIESIKLAAQYTILVSPKTQTSLAIGGITEFEFVDLDHISSRDMFEGLLLNPFFIAAKRWGRDFHTLVYTGPRLFRPFAGHGENRNEFEMHLNGHYMIPGTRNFVGVEVNNFTNHGRLETVLRPQMRLVIHENLMIGIVTGIPIIRTDERMSSFVRLIYEPHSKQNKKRMR